MSGKPDMALETPHASRPRGVAAFGYWLNYGWRVVATGYNFAFFFIGGLVLALTALPLARLLPGTAARKNERARAVVHRIFRYFVWQMQITGCIRVEVRDRARLAACDGLLVVANHPTLIDVVLLIALLPRASCVVKAELFRSATLRGVVRATGYISNSDPESLLRQCRDSFAAGQSIIVFPEGTRSRTGEPLQFQRGAAQIAVRCNADVAPVLITCEPPMLRKGEPWYRVPPRRGEIVVQPLPRWPLAELIDTGAPPPLATRQLNRALEARFRALLGQQPATNASTPAGAGATTGPDGATQRVCSNV